MSVIYKSAIEKKAKKKLPTRVSLVKSFAMIFQKEISQRMDEIVFIHQNTPIGSELASELKIFVNEALKCIHKVLSLKNGITTDCKSHIDELQRSLMKFKSSTQYLTSNNFTSGEDGANPWAILIDDCQHFINQFWMTCDLIWASKKPPFRPTDRELKYEFLKTVAHYDETGHNKKFPPYFWILKHLKM